MHLEQCWRRYCNDDTNPNTGIFEADVVEASQIIHDAGGLMYYDGQATQFLAGLHRIDGL